MRVKIGPMMVNIGTTHLQSSYPCKDALKFMQYRHVRRSQIIEIRDFFDSKVKNDFCVLAGDLNVDGREDVKPPAFEGIPCQEDYQMMVDILSRQGEVPVVDVIRERYGYSLPTYGRVDTDGMPLETVLTLKEESTLSQTLDHIFLIGNVPSYFKVVYEETVVVPFKVHNMPFTQISDHAVSYTHLTLPTNREV